MIKCELCIKETGKSEDYNLIHWSHLRRVHNINRDDYIKMFPNARLISDETRKIMGVTLENLILKYGKDLGTSKYNEYVRKQAYSNTLEYFINKYGIEDGTKKYNNANSLRAVTLKNQINKHGKDEGTKRYNEYVERQKVAGCTLEYFIDKYGEDEGRQKYKTVCFLKGHSYEAYLYMTNGDIEEASKLHNNYLVSQATNAGSRVSKVSQNLFKDIYDHIKYKYERIFFSDLNQEWFLSIKDSYGSNIYFIDFFIKDTGKIIEFNGDYWHANPKIFSSSTEISYPNNIKLKASDVWEADYKKHKRIMKVPYINNILYVWENDFKLNKEKTINKCLEFLCS